MITLKLDIETATVNFRKENLSLEVIQERIKTATQVSANVATLLKDNPNKCLEDGFLYTATMLVGDNGQQYESVSFIPNAIFIQDGKTYLTNGVFALDMVGFLQNMVTISQDELDRLK